MPKKTKTDGLNEIRQIGVEVDKINGLINDLLDVSRIESGRLQFNMAIFDFGDFVKKIVSDSKYLAKDHRLVLRRIPKIKIKGDQERLAQVLTNLITNAAKYSPAGSDIVVSAETDERTLTLKVQDFGIGIPQREQGLVFDKYYRAKNGEQKTRGLGLGLYIAKQIIDSHQGKIWVESQKNKGSTFSFSLPRYQL